MSACVDLISIAFRQSQNHFYNHSLYWASLNSSFQECCEVWNVLYWFPQLGCEGFVRSFATQSLSVIRKLEIITYCIKTRKKTTTLISVAYPPWNVSIKWQRFNCCSVWWLVHFYQNSTIVVVCVTVNLINNKFRSFVDWKTLCC